MDGARRVSDENPKTVTVPIWGGGQLTMPEPDWCAGHPTDSETHAVDFEHYGPVIEFAIETPRRPVPILCAALGMRPFDAAGARGEVLPHVAIEVAGDISFRFDPAELREFADQMDVQMAACVDELRQLADKLAALRGEQQGPGL